MPENEKFSELFTLLERDMPKAEAAEKSGILALTGYSQKGEELAALLVMLRALGIVLQTHHWMPEGQSFYGDHLLFERLYGDVVSEVDRVGERAVGVQSPDSVRDMARQSKGVAALCAAWEKDSPLTVEQTFLDTVNAIVAQMRQGTGLSRGTDNMLAEIQDKHEEHVYLLRQRA